MESRTRLAIGGMATVAASVTVICVVALTNSVALSETAGSPLDAAPVVVPASDDPEAVETPTPTPAATPKATPSPVPEPLQPAQTPTTPQTSPPTAEVVPAPEAQVVTPTRPAPVAEQPSRPRTPASLEEALAQAEASGSWAPVRAWAADQGWSAGRLDAFIAKLERSQDDRLEIGGERDSGRHGGSDSGRVQGGSTDSIDDRGARAGSSKERPARAGASADTRSAKPGFGAKKDRSRDSPERRDR